MANRRSLTEKLNQPRRPLRAVLIGAAALTVAVGVSLGTVATVNALTPPPPRPVVAADPLVYTGVQEDDATAQQQALQAAEADRAAQEAAAAAAAQAAAAQAAQQAAEQAARQAAAHHSASTSGKHPSGTPLPFIASSDPNNANGGDYEDPSAFCESGSASTVNGVPTCD